MSFDISDIGDDIIDSRDIESRIDELEAARSDWEEARQEYNDLIDQIATVTSELENSEESGEDEDAIEGIRQTLADLEEQLADLVEPDDEFEDQEELEKLIDFRDEVCSSEWTYGLTLIRDSYWVDYVQELVKDIGDMPRDIPSYIEIDWDATADNIKADYSEATIEGETYYFRNC